MVSNDELKLRQGKIKVLMQQANIDTAIITGNVNLLYTCGKIFNGYLYLPAKEEPWYFIKRPNNLTGKNVVNIKKAEQITEILLENGINLPPVIMLEADELSYNEYIRLAKIFGKTTYSNATPIIRQARSIKTSYEIEMFRQTAKAHTRAYQQIPNIYTHGMSDLHFSIEIERLLRLEGNLGLFRIYGKSMETFMGSVLAGNNAEIPSPYDFALGGEGLDAALPGGVNNKPMQPGETVMVDLGGNFNGYMGDLSRVFSIGKTTEEAYRGHQTCLEIQDKIASVAKPGVICEDLYHIAIDIVTRKGFANKFMGTRQQAKFIGHGIGLEINEAPVLAPRMKQELRPGMVFALEPKIVIPGVGPVGIENSWVVKENGIEKLTHCPEEIIELN